MPRLERRNPLGPLPSALAAASVAALLGGCLGGSDAPDLEARIQRTAYGVPHINAPTLAGVGYGVAYAYMQDNACLMADQVLTVTGERSKYLGPSLPVRAGTSLTNLQSDFVSRYLMDDAALTTLYAGVSAEAKQLIRGYVAGYNRALKDIGIANLPAACKGADWVRPITELDMHKLMHEKAIQASAGNFLAGLVDAAPPATGVGAAPQAVATPTQVAQRMAASLADAPQLGSNAYALGKDVTESGAGILLGNPHFPWSTTNRFYQMHLTVPGDIDVMGASLGGFALVNIGFNNDVAWSHTVSTARRFTFFELTMQGSNAYVIDGVVKPLTKKTITVQAKTASGALESRTHDFYASEHGPLLVGSGLTWSATKAFALKDANRDNARMTDQWLQLARAKSVDDVRKALMAVNGMPWVNTIAADRAGAAMYADISVTPYVNQAKLAACATSPTAQALLAGRTVLLDGSRAACDWDKDAAVAGSQLYPPASMPLVLRSDYAANSNDSAWLANPKQLLDGLPLIIGASATTQSVRTRMAFTQIADRLSGADGKGGNRFSPAKLEAIFFDNRSYAAELTTDALVALCQATPTATSSAGNVVDLRAACGVLAAWSKRMDFGAVGVPVFREFWRSARNIPGLFAVPFSAADPVNTPRQVNVGNATVSAALLKALADSVEKMAANSVNLNATLGTQQYALAGSTRIPINGGDEFEGTFNKMTPALGLTPAGYTPIASGSSYIQVVTWDANGPVARGILTYSQSTDPASPYAADQTLLYSTGKFANLPYKQSDIAADPALKTTQISE